MLTKRGIFVAVLTAAAMTFAGNSFAMMGGGGGGHGSYSSPSPYDHHRYYGNPTSIGFGTGSRWYDHNRTHHLRGGYRNNAYYHHEGTVYYDHMNAYDRHYPRQNRIEFSFNSPGGYGNYHHNSWRQGQRYNIEKRR